MASSDLVAITIHEGVGLKGGMFSQRDPYVVLNMGGQSAHTTVINGGGSNPKWEQTFTLPYNGEHSISLEVKDQDVGKDESMGKGHIDISALKAQKRWTTNVPITVKSKPYGSIRVTIALREARPQAGGMQAVIVPAVSAAPGYGQYGYAPATAYPPQPGYPPPGYYPPQGQYPGYGAPPPPNQYTPYPPQQGYPQPPAYGGYPPQQHGYPPYQAPPGQPQYPPAPGGAYPYPPHQQPPHY